MILTFSKSTLIKALCKLRKSKRDSLKNAINNNKQNIVTKRNSEISEIDRLIEKSERKRLIIII